MNTFSSGKRDTDDSLAVTLKGRTAHTVNPILDAFRDIYDSHNAALWVWELEETASILSDDAMDGLSFDLENAREENQVLGYIVGNRETVEEEAPETDFDSYRGILETYTVLERLAYAEHALKVAQRFDRIYELRAP